MKKRDRIKELELELETERLMTATLADELESILKPYRDRDPAACAIAVNKILATRRACGDCNRAVH